MHWKDEPRPSDLRFVLPVITVKPQQVLIVRLTCARWIGLDVHWNGNSNQVCIGETACQFCRQRLPQWQGFLTCERPSDTAQGLLRITSNIIDLLRHKFMLTGDLRGWELRLHRAGNRKNSPLIGKFLEKSIHVNSWSEDELRGHVARLFKLPGGLGDLVPAN